LFKAHREIQTAQVWKPAIQQVKKPALHSDRGSVNRSTFANSESIKHFPDIQLRPAANWIKPLFPLRQFCLHPQRIRRRYAQTGDNVLGEHLKSIDSGVTKSPDFAPIHQPMRLSKFKDCHEIAFRRST
jgi:hypothetical protein